MKKIFKILLVTTLALTLALGIVACSDKQNGARPAKPSAPWMSTPVSIPKP